MQSEPSAQHNSIALNLLYTAKAIRTFAFGALSVVFAIYLQSIGFTASQIGMVLSATLVEDALMTALVTALARKLGAAPILFVASAAMALSGLIMAFTTNFWIVAVVSVLGIISPGGFEGGPFGAIEQALIAKLAPAEVLPKKFSVYNLTGFAGAAVGALLAGYISGAFKGANAQQGYSIIFLAYTACSVIIGIIYFLLRIPKEADANDESKAKTEQHEKLSGTIWKFSGLQVIDAFGGGLIPQTLISFWFLEQYHAGPEFTGPVFFLTYVLGALSFFAAPEVCRKFGLLNTMVLTHLPCSLTLCLLPLMPNANAAGLILIVRSLFSSMDIPARQAYSMVLVPESQRMHVAGMIYAGRSIGQCAAPILSGASMASASGLAFYLAGSLKSFYDVVMYASFRKVPLAHEKEKD